LEVSENKLVIFFHPSSCAPWIFSSTVDYCLGLTINSQETQVIMEHAKWYPEDLIYKLLPDYEKIMRDKWFGFFNRYIARRNCEWRQKPIALTETGRNITNCNLQMLLRFWLNQIHIQGKVLEMKCQNLNSKERL
jgi:hypothetical protein